MRRRRLTRQRFCTRLFENFAERMDGKACHSRALLNFISICYGHVKCLAKSIVQAARDKYIMFIHVLCAPSTPCTLYLYIVCVGNEMCIRCIWANGCPSAPCRFRKSLQNIQFAMFDVCTHNILWLFFFSFSGSWPSLTAVTSSSCCLCWPMDLSRHSFDGTNICSNLITSTPFDSGEIYLLFSCFFRHLIYWMLHVVCHVRRRFYCKRNGQLNQLRWLPTKLLLIGKGVKWHLVAVVCVRVCTSRRTHKTLGLHRGFRFAAIDFICIMPGFIDVRYARNQIRFGVGALRLRRTFFGFRSANGRKIHNPNRTADDVIIILYRDQAVWLIIFFSPPFAAMCTLCYVIRNCFEPSFPVIANCIVAHRILHEMRKEICSNFEPLYSCDFAAEMHIHCIWVRVCVCADFIIPIYVCTISPLLSFAGSFAQSFAFRIPYHRTHSFLQTRNEQQNHPNFKRPILCRYRRSEDRTRTRKLQNIQ